MRGGAVRAIQEAAGHSSLRTKQRYMHVSPDVLDATIRLLDQRNDWRNTGEGETENVNSRSKST